MCAQYQLIGQSSHRKKRKRGTIVKGQVGPALSLQPVVTLMLDLTDEPVPERGSRKTSSTEAALLLPMRLCLLKQEASSITTPARRRRRV